MSKLYETVRVDIIYFSNTPLPIRHNPEGLWCHKCHLSQVTVHSLCHENTASPSRVTLVSHSLSCKATTMLITSHHHKKSTNLCVTIIYQKMGQMFRCPICSPPLGRALCWLCPWNILLKFSPGQWAAVSGSEGQWAAVRGCRDLRAGEILAAIFQSGEFWQKNSFFPILWHEVAD